MRRALNFGLSAYDTAPGISRNWALVLIVFISKPVSLLTVRAMSFSDELPLSCSSCCTPCISALRPFLVMPDTLELRTSYYSRSATPWGPGRQHRQRRTICDRAIFSAVWRAVLHIYALETRKGVCTVDPRPTTDQSRRSEG